MSADEIDGCNSPDCHDMFKGLISGKMSKKVFYPVVVALTVVILGIAGGAYTGHESRIDENEKNAALIKQKQVHLESDIKVMFETILKRLPGE